ncbi:hypothetical protein GOBAR_AA08605 [Gossypium barbadense]|uniref:Aspartic peptidase DDI1-type domain-containing protein n=1 Tax=Gossypium barbadense TaxID=3634 RepID=A0A2P5Y8X4_GOSBA|nr:hypothetical protein GOBAR_AA08605 [Gossypium barbadense]
MISKGVEAKPESETLKLGSMILNSVKVKRDRKLKRLMYVDINIAGQKKSALFDTGASNLFVSEKTVGKLGISISKSTKKVKTVNSKEVPTMGVAQGVELQIGQWKSKEGKL